MDLPGDKSSCLGRDTHITDQRAAPSQAARQQAGRGCLSDPGKTEEFHKSNVRLKHACFGAWRKASRQVANVLRSHRIKVVRINWEDQRLGHDPEPKVGGSKKREPVSQKIMLQQELDQDGDSGSIILIWEEAVLFFRVRRAAMQSRRTPLDSR